MVVGAVVLVPVGVADAGGELLVPWMLAAGAAVAMLSSAIPYALEMEALRRLPAGVFGVLMSLEPAMAALAGYVVLGEGLVAREIVAILLVVAASAGGARGACRRATRRRPQAIAGVLPPPPAAAAARRRDPGPNRQQVEQRERLPAAVAPGHAREAVEVDDVVAMGTAVVGHVADWADRLIAIGWDPIADEWGRDPTVSPCSAQVDRVRQDPGALAAVRPAQRLDAVDAGLLDLVVEQRALGGGDLHPVAQQPEARGERRAHPQRAAAGRRLGAHREVVGLEAEAARGGDRVDRDVAAALRAARRRQARGRARARRRRLARRGRACG